MCIKHKYIPETSYSVFIYRSIASLLGHRKILNYVVAQFAESTGREVFFLDPDPVWT